MEIGKPQVRFVPCVGSRLAGQNVTSRRWSVQPCVRPVSAVRTSKPGTRSAFQSSVMMSGISPTVAYLIGVPSIMIGSILFVGAIISLTIGREDETPPAKAPRKKNSSVRVMPGFLRPWR